MKKLLIIPLLFAGSLFAQNSVSKEVKTIKTVEKEQLAPKSTVKKTEVQKDAKKSTSKQTITVESKTANAKGTLVNKLDEAVEQKTKEQLAKPE